MTETYEVPDKELRHRILESVKKQFPPVEIKDEKYCDYVAIVTSEGSKVHLRQYSSGKLVLQGSQSALFDSIKDLIEHLCPPGSAVSSIAPEFASSLGIDPTQPYIGTDESGKGDYFGPLVVAGIYATPATVEALVDLGVKDSKQIPDSGISSLAPRIREVCAGHYAQLVLSPPEYNDLYSQIASGGGNLNSLLARCHAQVIETLLRTGQCNQVITDKFGDERLIRERIRTRRPDIRLIQVPGAEKDAVVAAASILARDAFLTTLAELQEEYGLPLPKGASAAVTEAGADFVTRYGPDLLRSVAKLHFSTTNQIL